MQTQMSLAVGIRRALIVMLPAVAAILWLTASPATAQESDDPWWNNATCYGCHQQSGLSVDLPSGEILYLAVFKGGYDNSVHGTFGVSCRNCHTDIQGFPHPDLTAGSLADFSDQLAGSCEICHRDHYTKVADEIHTGPAMLACSECHDPHTTGTGDVATEVAVSCGDCHPEGQSIPAEGIHAAPELPERHQSTSGLTILLILGGAIVGFVVLVWLVTVAWRVIRERA